MTGTGLDSPAAAGPDSVTGTGSDSPAGAGPDSGTGTGSDGAGLDSWVRDRFGVRLETAASPLGWKLTDLVGLALRRNPRRAHLLVSTVLGKHVPTDPQLIRGVGHLLGLLVAADLGLLPPAVAAELPAAADELLAGRPERLDRLLVAAPAAGAQAAVFGFAETATGLGHCVADALGACWYLHSTRRHIADVPVSARFEEGHSHATSHLVQPNPPALLTEGDALVLVDDEFSTGATAIQAITGLHTAAPRDRYVVAALIDLRSDADAAAMQEFARELGCTITVVALVSGRVQLPTGLTAAAADYIATHSGTEIGPTPGASPGAGADEVTRVDVEWPADLPEGGRHSVRPADTERFEKALAAAAGTVAAALPADARRILVVGTEEFMYLPLRLAALIGRRDGFQARFQTTTRSPVHPEPVEGYPVVRAFRFVSPEGLTDAPRFLYNADWRDADGRRRSGAVTEPDSVVIVIDAAMDTPALYGPDGLLAALGATAAPQIVVVIPGCRPETLGDHR